MRWRFPSKLKSDQRQRSRIFLRTATFRCHDLEVNKISANIYAGRLQGDARLRRGPIPRLEVRQTLSGMSIRPLLVDLFSFGQLDGKGSGRVTVAAQGQSFVDLRNSLGGDVQMSLNHGNKEGVRV